MTDTETGMLNLVGDKSGLIAHSTRPLNAEPPLDVLHASFITPNEHFYVRCHGEIPKLDRDTHTLHVGGAVAKPLALSMRALSEGFPRRTVVSTIQCAGNRRADLHRVRPVMGDKWAGGAIGNATWTGVALADVLRNAGVSDFGWSSRRVPGRRHLRRRGRALPLRRLHPDREGDVGGRACWRGK